MIKKLFKFSYIAIIIIFIYTPIIILIIFSFNHNDSLYIFSKISKKWYIVLFQEHSFLQSIFVSIFIALISTIISIIIGLMTAIGLNKTEKFTQKITLFFTNIPLINADIITAISLMMLFISLNFNFGFLTLILSHITINIPYVIIIIMPKLKKMDYKLIEASVDLGAKYSQTLIKVIIPILKPSIITAAAITFAISFDDFIISYFTCGEEINVAIFIYTMKRIKPFINAFGAICIVIISFIIISWNGWNIYKINYKKKLNKILENIYFNKQIINYEYKLIQMYTQLNKTNISDKHKNILRIKIIKLENKYIKKQQLINIKKNIFFTKTTNEIKQKKIIFINKWILRNLKSIILILIYLSFLCLLTTLYIKNNIYDLIVANWSGYIQDNIIHDFEIKNNVKIKYVIYDSNENLYNKLYTTNYDIMVPSDYMINKLASENRLELINYSILNQNKHKFRIIKPNNSYYKNNQNLNKWKEGNIWFNNQNVDIEWYKKNDKEFYNKCIQTINIHKNCINVTKTASLNNSLLKIMNKNQIKTNITNKVYTITDYSIPLYWGNMSLVIKPTLENISFIKSFLYQKNKNLNSNIIKYNIYEKKWMNNKKQYIINDFFIKNNYINGISWEILWQAANAGKKVILNNDFKNLFMIANQIINQNSLPINIKQANLVFQKLKILIKNSNVFLMNDEIINTVKDGFFDFALMYNGDAIYADSIYNQKNKFNQSQYKLIITYPRNSNLINTNTTDQNIKIEGTNIWSDNFVISKKSKNKKLAYNFINYIISRQRELTEFTYYTSPFQQVINHEIKNSNNKNKQGKMFKYIKEYIPVSIKINNQYFSHPINSDGPFTINLLNDYLINLYNILIANKY